MDCGLPEKPTNHPAHADLAHAAIQHDGQGSGDCGGVPCPWQCRSRTSNPESVDARQFTPALVRMGKQLYEVKYQCQSCHTIGGTGGYVGPNLNNAGNWLTPAWIEAWLRNPQALQPDTIEPRRNFTDDEIRALTAYLMTLRRRYQIANVKERRECASHGAGSRPMKSKLLLAALLLVSVLCAGAFRCKKTAAAGEARRSFRRL